MSNVDPADESDSSGNVRFDRGGGLKVSPDGGEIGIPISGGVGGGINTIGSGIKGGGAGAGCCTDCWVSTGYNTSTNENLISSTTFLKFCALSGPPSKSPVCKGSNKSVS